MTRRLVCLGALVSWGLVSQPPERFVLVIQYPPDQKIKLPFFRTGGAEKISAEGEVRRRQATRVKVELKDAPAPSAVHPQAQSWVLWAVDADGAFTRLGSFDGKNLDVETPLTSFGLVISAEPDAAASAPKGVFVLETHFPDKKTRYFGMTKVVYSGKKE
jgi:hypothetical protein